MHATFHQCYLLCMHLTCVSTHRHHTPLMSSLHHRVYLDSCEHPYHQYVTMLLNSELSALSSEGEAILGLVQLPATSVSDFISHTTLLDFGTLNYCMYRYILLLLVYLPTMFVVNAWTWAWTTHKARTMAEAHDGEMAQAIAEKAAKDALVPIICQFTISFSLVAMFRHYW